MNLKTLTVKQAMALTGFPRGAVYALIHNGGLRFIKGEAQAARIRIFESSLIDWMTTHAQGTPVRPTTALDADAALPPVESPFL